MSDLHLLAPMILTVPVATPVLMVAWLFMQMTANMDEGRIAPIALAWLPATPMVFWLLNGGSISLAAFFIAASLSGIAVLLLALRVQPATHSQLGQFGVDFSGVGYLRQRRLYAGARSLDLAAQSLTFFGLRGAVV